MSERLVEAYRKRDDAERKARVAAADPARAEQKLMGELFKHRNPELYPPPGPAFGPGPYEARVLTRGYKMTKKVREQLTARGLLPRSGEGKKLER